MTEKYTSWIPDPTAEPFEELPPVVVDCAPDPNDERWSAGPAVPVLVNDPRPVIDQRPIMDKMEQDVINGLLTIIGEDPERGGLLETPARVVKAWKFWCSGYKQDAASILKVFEDGAENYDQMVVVKDIPIYSHCEHHMAPIIGTVTIAYIPDGKIVGLSKLSRLAEMFARRLQVQERLTDQIADSLMEHLAPIGVGVVIKARHLCMESRGVCQQGHHTITTALRGAMRNDPTVRAEFLSHSK
jgi:GTP cyclohydrolase I